MVVHTTKRYLREFLLLWVYSAVQIVTINFSAFKCLFEVLAGTVESESVWSSYTRCLAPQPAGVFTFARLLLVDLNLLLAKLVLRYC